MSPCHAVQAGEEGFTLIELIIVIVILPLVIGGVAAALLAILQNESTTFNRVGDSADAQITSANFSRDVQSAYRMTTGSMASICQGSLAVPPATPLLGLQGSQTITRTFRDGTVANNSRTLSTQGQGNFSAADVNSLVSDASGDIPQGTTISGFNPMLSNRLTMSKAATGNAPANDVVTITLVKSWMASYWENPVGNSNQLVREFCVLGSNAFLPSSSEIVAHDLPSGQGFNVSCSSALSLSQCQSAATSSGSWLSMNGVASVTLSAAEPASGYQFNLSASPRNSSTASSATPALTLTNTLAVPSPSDSLSINGQLSFNSNSLTSQLVGSGNVSISAASGPPAITEVQCGSSCSQVTASFSGTLQCNSVSCPVATSTGSAAPQPSVPAPTYPSPSGPTEACTTSGITMTCPPGYYSGPVTAGPSVTNVVFMPGNYSFSGTVSFGAPVVSVSFGAGTYSFSAGSGGLELNAPGISVSGSNVFFYFFGGSLTTQADTIQLSAPTTGPYSDELVYQVPGDSTSMILSGTGSFGGTVDATGSYVILGGNGDNFSVGSLLAASATLGNAIDTVTVGT